MSDLLQGLASSHRQGKRIGITSMCSAHPRVIRAAVRHGARHREPVLIEATCNQVNQNRRSGDVHADPPTRSDDP